MSDEDYKAALNALREEWGGIHVDEQRRGYIIAEHDPSAGILVGMRAKLIAEIINRALSD